MKKYNKPVVEINGFEVEDVIAASGWFTGMAKENELQAVYLGLKNSDTVDVNDSVGVYEW